MDYNEIIVTQCIDNEWIMEIGYDDDEPRFVVPVHVGYSKSGKKLMMAYQIYGYTSSGGIPNWRLFNTSKIHMRNIFFESYSPPYWNMPKCFI